MSYESLRSYIRCRYFPNSPDFVMSCLVVITVESCHCDRVSRTFPRVDTVCVHKREVVTIRITGLMGNRIGETTPHV